MATKRRPKIVHRRIPYVSGLLQWARCGCGWPSIVSLNTYRTLLSWKLHAAAARRRGEKVIG